MADDSPRRDPLGITTPRKVTLALAASYVLDWCFVAAGAGVGWWLGNRSPNRRPFQLEDPDISFPFTVHETVSSTNLFIAGAVVPAAVIILFSLLLVPAGRGVPARAAWQRRLWELHAGLLGLALALAWQWMLINWVKNLFGKPRPDLLARCQPDLANLARYVLGGGIANLTSNGQLVSGDICTNPDKATLEDGFRSYPSGHSGTSAAGLIYLALFMASRLGVGFPSATREAYELVAARGRSFGRGPSPSSSYPSGGGGRATDDGSYELVDHPGAALKTELNNNTNAAHWDHHPYEADQEDPSTAHALAVLALRRTAAAAPVYLLFACAVPVFGSLFIAGSRWFDFRHHGFDIINGYLIGLFTACFSFYYYHMPVGRGAGWAWGARGGGFVTAFFGGVGGGAGGWVDTRFLFSSSSASSPAARWAAAPRGGLQPQSRAGGGAVGVRPGDEEEALGATDGHGPGRVRTGESTGVAF